MLPPLVLIQQRCVDPCPGRFRSPLHDNSRTIDAYSSHHRFSSRSHERYDQRVAYSDVPAHWRRPLSRESPPSRHLDFTSKSFSHLRGASPHGEPRRLRRGESPHGTSSRLLRSASITALPSPPQEGVDSQWRAPTTRRVASRRSPSPAQRLLVSRWSPSPTQRHVSSRGSPPAKRMGLASVAGPSSFRKPLYGDLRPTRRSYRELFSPQRDSHSSRHRCYEARDSVSPQQLHSSWASSQDPCQGFFRSLLAGSSHHDSRRYLRFVEKELTSSKSYASG